MFKQEKSERKNNNHKVTDHINIDFQHFVKNHFASLNFVKYLVLSKWCQYISL